MVDAERVRQILAEEAGTQVATPEACARIQALLETYVPRKTDLTAMSERLEDIVFDCLYAGLGRQMMAVLDSGEVRRFRMDDLPELADWMLMPLFESLDVNAANYALLRSMAMENGSVSAMAVLYRRYRDCQSEAELAVLGRVLRGRYPRGREPEWLRRPG